MSELANIADYAVKIDGETYTMTKLPPATSKLVQDERSRVLKTIKLEKLIDGLTKTGDLINLAYNATPAKYGELRAPIARLQDRFGKLCMSCMQEMDNVVEATRAILPNITRTFSFLLDGKDDLAISFLARCATQAQQLSQSVGALAKEFDSLADDTMTILNDAEVARGIELKKAEELRAKAKEIEAKTAEAKELAEKLAQSKKELQRLYDEAKEKAETAENRAFALSMVSAILKPLGEGLGAFASAYTQSANPLSRLMPPSTPKKEKGDKTPKDDKPATEPKKAESKEELEVKKGKAEKALADAKDAKTKADEAVDTAKSAVKDKETKVKDAEKKVEQVKDDKDAQPAADKALSDAKAEKTNADVVLNAKEGEQKTAEGNEAKAQSNLNEIMAALAGIGKALSSAGESMGKMGGDYNSAAEGYRQEKLKYLDMLMEKQDKERETLAAMQRYAIEMKNMGEQEQTAEMTANALFQAIAALKQVVVVLRDAALFWSNMAEHCKRLANPGMKQDIEDFKKEDREMKLSIYREDNFKESVVRYYAGWMALNAIAQEYMEKNAEVRDRVSADFANYLDDKAARAKAQQLGDSLLKEFQKDIDANEAIKKGISDAKTATEQEKQAA